VTREVGQRLLRDPKDARSAVPGTSNEVPVKAKKKLTVILTFDFNI